MDKAVLESELKKLDGKGNLNQTEKRKRKKYKEMLEQIMAGESGNDGIDEEGVGINGEESGESTDQVDYDLKKAESRFTGVAVDNIEDPSVVRFMELFNVAKVLPEESNEYITIRIHKGQKEWADGMATRINSFSSKKISGPQVIECMIEYFKLKNKNQVRLVNEMFLDKISSFV